MKALTEPQIEEIKEELEHQTWLTMHGELIRFVSLGYQHDFFPSGNCYDARTVHDITTEEARADTAWLELQRSRLAIHGLDLRLHDFGDLAQVYVVESRQAHADS